MNRFVSILSLVVSAPIALLACGSSSEEVSGSASRYVVDPRDDEAPEPKGEPCGSVTCGEGLVCCNASCGMCASPELSCIQITCGDDEPAPPPPAPCFRGGCSGEVCSDRDDLASVCLWEPEFACYQKAACERQSDGACGWTDTPELQACLASPPP